MPSTSECERSRLVSCANWWVCLDAPFRISHCCLIPSMEEKVAMLLYLVTKNHSFSDGNKRIAATLFLWFLNNNGILYREDGSKRIADSTLVALTLMIAESRTEEKDVMVKVVVNLINKNNDE